MKKIQYLLYLLLLIPLTTGLNALLYGLGMYKNLGVTLTHDQLMDPLLNSQIRFLGATWLGFGVLCFIFVRKMNEYNIFLKYSLVFVVIGGMGRVFSLYEFGLPHNTVTSIILICFIIIEVVMIPIILFYIYKLKV